MTRVLHRGFGRVGAQLRGCGPTRSVFGRGEVIDDAYVFERGVRRTHVPGAVALHRDDERPDVGRKVARVDHGRRGVVARCPDPADQLGDTLAMRLRGDQEPVQRDLDVPGCELLVVELQIADLEVDARQRLARVVDELQLLRPLADAVDTVTERADLVGREHVDCGQRVLVVDRVRELADGTVGRVRTAAADQRRDAERDDAEHRGEPARGQRGAPRPPPAARTLPRPCSRPSCCRRARGSAARDRYGAPRARLPHHRSSRRARRSHRPTRSPRRARHPRRARCHGWRAGPGVRSCHSPLDSTLSSTRSRRRARISATRADGGDIPTRSAASFDRMPSTSTRYSSARTRSGSRRRSVSSLG